MSQTNQTKHAYHPTDDKPTPIKGTGGVDRVRYPRPLKDNDVVKQPGHYTAGGIEVIDFIRAKLTREQLKGYYLGNLIKYISRAERKAGVEDYKKAAVYLEWMIQWHDQEI